MSHSRPKPSRGLTRWKLALWACLLSCSAAVAGIGDGVLDFNDAQAGTAVLPFLKIPLGARASAMGSYDGPALKDPTAVFWNPARLPTVSGFQTEFSHSEYLGEWRHEAASTVFPVPRVGNLGLGFSGLFATPFQGARDIEENSVKIVALDFALGAAWGVSLWNGRLLVGTKAQWIHSQLDDVQGDGYALDLGASWPMVLGIQGSAVLQNMAHGFSYRSGTNTTEKVPAVFRLGLGYADTSSAWGWQAGYSKSNDGMQRLSAGGEWNWRQTLFLRTGYEWDFSDVEAGPWSGLAGGLGLRLSTLGLDYSVRSQGMLGLVHTITFSVHPPSSWSRPVEWGKMARKAWEKGNCIEASDDAEKALREDPANLDAVAILQACQKEERISKGDYLALAFTANTEGQALSFWDGDMLTGGLSRRKALLDRLRMQYPSMKVLDAGRLFSRDSLEKNGDRILDLYARLPVDKVLLGESDSRFAGDKARGALPWLPADSATILKVGAREIGVFGFSTSMQRPLTLDHLVQQVQRARDAWGHAPAIQVLLLDGPVSLAEKVSAAVSGIDLIVVSGEQQLLARPMQSVGTWIVAPGRRGESVGMALAWFSAGRAPAWEFRMLPVDESVRPDSTYAQDLGEDWQSVAGENTRVVDRASHQDFLYLQALPDGRKDLWLSDQKVKRSDRLTRTPANIVDAQMAWSRQAFFFQVDSGEGRTGLYLQSVKEKVPQRIGDSVGSVVTARWEPFENWLYYLRADDPAHVDLCRVTWKGTHPVNLSHGTIGLAESFDFSPDGRTLVVGALQDGRHRVFRAGLTLAHKEAVSPDSVVAMSPLFSPKGSSVAYLSRPLSAKDTLSWDLALWDLRDDQTKVLLKAQSIHRMQWSADGRHLFMEVGVNLRSIQVVDVTTAEVTQVRSSFESVSEELNPHSQRIGEVDGMLFQARSAGKSQLLWVSPESGSTPIVPVDVEGAEASLPSAP